MSPRCWKLQTAFAVTLWLLNFFYLSYVCRCRLTVQTSHREKRCLYGRSYVANNPNESRLLDSLRVLRGRSVRVSASSFPSKDSLSDTHSPFRTREPDTPRSRTLAISGVAIWIIEKGDRLAVFRWMCDFVVFMYKIYLLLKVVSSTRHCRRFDRVLIVADVVSCALALDSLSWNMFVK
jgi:hypothetical protein